MSRTLPSGRVTFAFTDVVGSTRTFIEHGPVYAEAVQRLQATVAEHAGRHGGVVVSTEGDGAMLAFSSARAAVTALTELQAGLASRPDNGLRLHLRAGAHTGDAEPIGDLYVALPVYVAARVSATAGAGQVIISQDTIDELDTPVGTRLGEFALKDLSAPVVLWRVAGDDAPPKAAPARRTNVAEPHTSFVGRAAEMSELSRMLERAHVVTVVGAGGLGKTRLVSEFALAFADAFAGGIWLCELASLTSPAQVLPEVAGVLGLRSAPTLESLRSEINRRGDVVVVIDNCEHLVDAVAGLVADLAEGSPALRLLCTSREALDVAGEVVLRLGPLAIAEGEGAAAQQLFRSRAEAAGAVVGPRERSAVGEICSLLDGVPIALELAAARAPVLTMPDLAAALREGDIKLARRGGDERQRNLDSLVGWSLRLLEPPVKDALLALAAFPGRFTAEMAEAVLRSVPGVPANAAPELARRSLLDLDGAEYRTLVTVGTVARRQLEERPDLRRAAMDGLFAWAVPEPGTYQELDDDLTADQIRALEVACAWGMEHKLPGYGRLLRKVTFWGLERTISPTLRALVTRVLASPLEATEDGIRAEGAALRALHGAAIVHTDGARADRAREMVAVARTFGDPWITEFACSHAAVVLDRAGLHAEAQHLHLEAIEHRRGEPGLAGSALLDLGVSYHLDGRLDEAERTYREALEFLAGDRSDRSNCLLNIGEVMLDTGRYEEAAAQLTAGIQAARGRTNACAWALALLAEVEARRGLMADARAIAAEAEQQLEPLVANDPSMAHALARMRAALASLDR